MFCAYMRPRYQVSVYRTIGPLVILSNWSVIEHRTRKHDIEVGNYRT